MSFQLVKETDRSSYNTVITHPLQTFEWGEFRKKTGVIVIRKLDIAKYEGYQLTIHKIPHTPYTIGYLPKGKLPTKELIEELKIVGKENKCIFIQLEPDVIKDEKLKSEVLDSLPSAAHPLFTKYTFVLDITKSEDELLKQMHPKTRYNIRVAQKHGVIVEEDNSGGAFQKYLDLTQETTKRQKFYAHSMQYHKTQWQTLPHTHSKNTLSSHLIVARHNKNILVAWIVFVFNDTLYYPYGASSTENREIMASNLQMWETIRFGKRLGLQTFDMWGALGPTPNPTDPWFGFHRFKQGYGAVLTEFAGSYDLIINKPLYTLYTLADKLRWTFLKLKK